MNKSKPQRRCVACFKSYDKDTLYKIVKMPDGSVVYDRTGKLDGRGAYICKNMQCIEKAKKTNAPGRALKCEIPESIYELIIEGQAENGG